MNPAKSPLFFLSLALLALASLLAVLIRRGVRPDVPQESAQTAGGLESDAASLSDPKDMPWSDASQVALRANRVRVGVSRVEYGEVRGKDAANRVIVSEKANFLLVFLQIKNLGAAEITYHSWYGQAFDDEGTVRVAQLSDNQGRDYDMMTFSDVKTVKGHTPEAHLKPLDQVADVLIFQIPSTVDRADVKSFRLELPAAAYAATGSYRFEIPRSMIEGFENDPAE